MTSPHRVTTRIGLWFVVLLIGMQAAIWLAAEGRHAWEQRQPARHWFTYRQVSYVDTVGDELLMASTAAWHRKVDRVAWVDVLRCETPAGQMAIYDTQSSEAADFGPRDLKTSEWSFTADFPTDGRVCVVHSTITIEDGDIVKSTTVQTARFIPQGEPPT